jgi:hypothetical protein
MTGSVYEELEEDFLMLPCLAYMPRQKRKRMKLRM